MRTWGLRQWGVAAVGTIATLLLLGVPAVLIPNGLFTREIEPTCWSYPVWIATSILAGLVMATYVRGVSAVEETRSDRDGGRSMVGAALAWFAIGCPVCNKLVLLALGTSGAMAWFAPLQPVLAVAGMVFLSWALWSRLRTANSCPVPARVD
ncbi:hypothetical protein [Nocardiopsis alkaliphila]|uniref:hypothetical protein n=1 Tax=Nocardiopsis alkaliphila TaxID=225762 RepID=UPI0003474A3E|nr:hypothetical protein [Nocardiopsis alkaliphila]